VVQAIHRNGVKTIVATPPVWNCSSEMLITSTRGTPFPAAAAPDEHIAGGIGTERLSAV